jgi:transcriptional antiterminator RfaH
MAFWGVAQTENQRERTAKTFLEKDGFETYLPLTLSGDIRQRRVPLFPSYLFIWIEERFSSIDWTVGVQCLLKWGDVPARVPDIEIRKLRRQQRDGIIRLPRRELELGDPFRILHGPFAGLDGLFDGMSGRDRVWLLLSILGAQRRTEFLKKHVRVLLPACE